MKLSVTKWFVAIAAMLLVSNNASAALINMLVSNVDVQYDNQESGGMLFDRADPNGGNLLPSESRQVTSTEFELDNVTQALLMDPPDTIYFDLGITNLGSSLTPGVLVNNQGGTGSQVWGLDWFTADGYFLRLGVDEISYIVVETGMPGLNFFNFFASAKVLSQNLPNGLQYAEDVLLSYTSTDVMLMKNPNNTVNGLLASGQLTVTGENIVPEPASAFILLGLLGTSAVAMRYRLG
jgi:hypothetical protein